MSNNKLENILVVEDNDGDFMLAEDYLEEAFVTVNIKRAKNFKTLTRLIIEGDKAFDIILLDLTLPDKSGVDLITETVKLTTNIPIIVLTGYSDVSFAVETLSYGVSDYLIKDQLDAQILFKSILYAIERFKMTKTLEISRQQYSDLFHLSPLPMWIYDLETLAFLGVNHAAINHYGFSNKDFLNMTIKDLRPQEEVPKLEKALNYLKTTGKLFEDRIFKHQKRDGSIILVEIISQHIKLGTKDARLVLANDITKQITYLQAIEKQNEKLKDIAWTQSHEVRAPLARIMGLVDYVTDEATLLDEKLNMLSHISDSAKEMDVIVKSIIKKSQKLNID